MIKYPEIADISVVADRIYLKNRVIVGSLPLKIKFIYSLISYLAYLGEKWPELTAKQTTWCRGHVPSWGGRAFCFRTFGLELSPRVTANCRFHHTFRRLRTYFFNIYLS